MPSRQQTTTSAARAYVLIEVEAGRIDAAIAALRELPMVVTVDAVIGPCDIIAIIETPDERAIGRLVIDNIHAIAGIKRTTTCFVVQ
jgi:DNA-binding Lrp family transcriptional regulator